MSTYDELQARLKPENLFHEIGELTPSPTDHLRAVVFDTHSCLTISFYERMGGQLAVRTCSTLSSNEVVSILFPDSTDLKEWSQVELADEMSRHLETTLLFGDDAKLRFAVFNSQILDSLASVLA